MSQFEQLFQEAGVEKDKIIEMVETLASNPMAIMSFVQELNLPPDFMQKAMAILMQNPEDIVKFAQNLGLDESIIAEAKDKLQSMMPSASP